MEDNLTDEDTQRKLKLSHLFRSPGWPIFESEITSLLDGIDAQIEQFLANPLTVEDLQGFNELLARRRAFRSVLLIKESLAEEIENSPETEA